MSTDTPTYDECRSQRPRPINVPPHTRIVHCDLPRGHDGDHCESDTETTWAAEAGADTPTTPAEALRWAAERVDSLRGHEVAVDGSWLRRWADELECANGRQTPDQQERAGSAESAAEPSSTGPAEALDPDATLPGCPECSRPAASSAQTGSSGELDLASIDAALVDPDDTGPWRPWVVQLAAEVRRLRGEQDAWLRWADEQVSEAQAERDQARARVAELETALRWSRERETASEQLAADHRSCIAELETERDEHSCVRPASHAGEHRCGCLATDPPPPAGTEGGGHDG